jgi:hypothetical protein
MVRYRGNGKDKNALLGERAPEELLILLFLLQINQLKSHV